MTQHTAEVLVVAFGFAFLGCTGVGSAADSLPDRLEDELRVHFYNVGAGSCALVECPGPNARPIIVDCGSIGELTISVEKLKARIHDALGDQSPEVVMSHSDEDHISLIPDILNDIRVSAIWQGDDFEDYNDEDFRRWVLRQQEQGAAIHRRFAKDWHNDGQPIANGLDCGSASTYVLTVNSGEDNNNANSLVNSGADDNANSLVLMLRYGSFSAIFTGDATGVTESSAMANFDSDLRTTVLTASHHGASTERSNSREWVATTQPAVIIYSAGRRYGHPRCTVTKRFADHLAMTPKHDATCGESSDSYRQFTTQRAEYMTRVNGTITVTTNGLSPLRLDCELDPGCKAVKIPFK